jgi:hypothetical protein
VTEREKHAHLEHLAGGPDMAFRLLRVWTTAQEATSGNRFTLRSMPTAEEVFHKRAQELGYSEECITYYLEEM